MKILMVFFALACIGFIIFGYSLAGIMMDPGGSYYPPAWLGALMGFPVVLSASSIGVFVAELNIIRRGY